MTFLDLFEKPVKELEKLPNNPKVLWYVSAGNDFKPTVFLTDFNIKREKSKHNRNFIKPDLFVYNCIGDDVNKLRENLKNNSVLYQDERTKISGKNFKTLNLKKKFMVEINPNYIRLDEGGMSESTADAFYFELIIEGEDYQEKQPVLYFEHENIDFFEKVIRKKYFDINYLCATREGTSFGNCKKSILQHVYLERDSNKLIEEGFKPNYIICFKNPRSEHFKKSIESNSIIEYEEDFGQYIYENPKLSTPKSIIYKLKYKE